MFYVDIIKVIIKTYLPGITLDLNSKMVTITHVLIESNHRDALPFKQLNVLFK